MGSKLNNKSTPTAQLRKIFDAAGFPGPMKLTPKQLEKIARLRNKIILNQRKESKDGN
jgi:hypothetical protein